MVGFPKSYWRISFLPGAVIAKVVFPADFGAPPRKTLRVGPGVHVERFIHSPFCIGEVRRIDLSTRFAHSSAALLQTISGGSFNS
jgi:hypothetical protein